jgi:hypothetical protein
MSCLPTIEAKQLVRTLDFSVRLYLVKSQELYFFI